MITIRKTEKKFELILDNVVNACLDRLNSFDINRVLHGVPTQDQNELISRLTFRKGEDFFEQRRELYQKIFKEHFMRNGKVIPPVPNGQRKHRFSIAGPYFTGKRALLSALFNHDKSVPSAVQKCFDLANNKHSIYIDAKIIRESLPEYVQAKNDNYPYPNLIIRGEVDALCKLMIDTAKICGYNIVDMSESHIRPKSGKEIDIMKGIQRDDGEHEEYNLYFAGISANEQEIHDNIIELESDEKTRIIRAEESVHKFSKPDSFQKLMRHSTKSFLLWDNGKDSASSRFSNVATCENKELTIHDHVKWGQFRRQVNTSLDPSADSTKSRWS